MKTGIVNKVLAVLLLLVCAAVAQDAPTTPPGFVPSGDGIWSRLADTVYYRDASGLDTSIIIYYDTVWNLANFQISDNMVVTGLLDAQSGIITRFGTSPGFIRWYEPSGNGTDFFSIAAQAMDNDYTFVWPLNDGAASEVLTTDGSGNLTWGVGGGGGTADSMGVDADGNGTVDSYLYSTTAGAFHLKKGANVTLTVTGDTVTIAGPAAGGTADSLGVDTDGNGTVDSYLYSTTAGAFHIKKGTGITLTVDTDTLTITGLELFTPADDNDTSVFTATAPNTTVGFNDQLTMQGNNIIGVNGLFASAVAGRGAGTFYISGATASNEPLHLQFGSTGQINYFADTRWIMVGDSLLGEGTNVIRNMARIQGQVISLDTTIAPDADSVVKSKKYIDDADALYLPLAGGTMAGTINANDNHIDNVETMDVDSLYVGDTLAAPMIVLTGGASGTLKLLGATDGDVFEITVPDNFTAPTAWVLPGGDGTANYQLTTDGSGGLSWAAASGAGADFADVLGVDPDGADIGQTSVGKLEFYDAGLYLDADADGVMDINSDGTLELHSADWDITTTGVITNTAIDADNNTVTNLGDASIDNDITIDLATLATTVTVTDDESTNDNQEIVFTTDNVNLESDGTFHYNPSAGKMTVPEVDADTLRANNIFISGDSIVDFAGSNLSVTDGVLNAVAVSVAYDNIGDPDGNGSIAMGAYTGTYTSSTSGWGGMFMTNTSTPEAATTLLTLGYTADGDADGKFLSCLDNTSDEKFSIGPDGAVTAGNITVTTMLKGDSLDVAKYTDGSVDPPDLADADFGDFTVSSGVAAIDSGGVLLNEVGHPTADVEFTMSNKTLKLDYGGNISGHALEIELGGNSSADGLHAHQHTGNPTAGHLVHAEADDDDLVPGTFLSGMDTVTQYGRTDSVIGSWIDTAGIYHGDLDADTIDISGDKIVDFNGGGLTVASNVLAVTDDIQNHTLDSAEVMAIWRDTTGYEWIHLTQVHGFPRALTDSIYLYDFVQIHADTLVLVYDSAGNITASDDDTVNVAGSIPYACTIDSIEVMYRISSGSEIEDGYLKGPDLSTPSGLCDSVYETFATDLVATAWDTAQYAITDIVAAAGDRYSYKYIVNFDTDNDLLEIGWIRMRVRR